MNTCQWLERRKGIVAAVMLIAALGSNAAAADSPRSCDLSLTVELWPDVPDASDAGFLSSLLSNHTSYRLTLRQQRSSTVVDLDLTGPGPDERCEKVVDSMRRDGRVLSVHVQQADANPNGLEDSQEGVAVVAAPLRSEQRSDTHLSAEGIGSLYWAAQHPPQAWRVLVPIFSGDSSGASENVRPSCMAFPGPPNEEAPCG